jgi:hypothetical protein
VQPEPAPGPAPATATAPGAVPSSADRSALTLASREVAPHWVPDGMVPIAEVSVGMHVRHATFGTGIVRTITVGLHPVVKVGFRDDKRSILYGIDKLEMDVNSRVVRK